MLGGESFFLNTYTADKTGESIALAPPLPGDISVIEMTGKTLLVRTLSETLALGETKETASGAASIRQP